MIFKLGLNFNTQPISWGELGRAHPRQEGKKQDEPDLQYYKLADGCKEL